MIKEICSWLHTFRPSNPGGSQEPLERLASKRKNKYVGPACYRAEMYAGRVVCCPLVSHVEYSDATDRRTDKRTPETVTLRFSLDVMTSWPTWGMSLARLIKVLRSTRGK